MNTSTKNGPANAPLALNTTRTTAELVQMFADWRTANGYADFGGDAEELQNCHAQDMSEEQVSWLVAFCEVWETVAEREDRGVEIARLNLGPADLRRVITITQKGANLFAVTNWEECDGEKSSSRTQNFAQAALAFQRATELMADEVGDICDTVEG